MKRFTNLLFLFCIIALTACSVKPSPARLCVTDEYLPSQTPAFTLCADIPNDCVALTDCDAQRVLYAQGDYEIMQEVFFADSAREGIKAVTGKDMDALHVLKLSSTPQEEYRFSWAAAGEGGAISCCGTLLYDGETCYALTFQCPSALENHYRNAFYHILSNVSLSPV